MLDRLAYWIGYTVMVAGGIAVTALILWECVELVFRRLGWTQKCLRWMYAEARRKDRELNA